MILKRRLNEDFTITKKVATRDRKGHKGRACWLAMLAYSVTVMWTFVSSSTEGAQRGLHAAEGGPGQHPHHDHHRGGGQLDSRHQDHHEEYGAQVQVSTNLHYCMILRKTLKLVVYHCDIEINKEKNTNKIK